MFKLYKLKHIRAWPAYLSSLPLGVLSILNGAAGINKAIQFLFLASSTSSERES